MSISNTSDGIYALLKSAIEELPNGVISLQLNLEAGRQATIEFKIYAKLNSGGDIPDTRVKKFKLADIE